MLLLERFNNITAWNSTGVNEFSAFAATIMDGAQSVTARMVDVYVSQILSEISGARVNPKGINITGNLRGVPSREVYARPFVEVWSGLKDGLLFDEAKQNGASRLSEIADDDMSLAYREGARKSFAANKITKFRRVVRPELSKGGTCPLCHLASGNTYNRSLFCRFTLIAVVR